MSQTGNRTLAEKLFNVAWRLAIFALPWQTRWFADAQLGGWPWEQGRWSVYGSWILLLGVIAFGFAIQKRKTSATSLKRAAILVGGFLLTSILAILLHPDWQQRSVAIAQWWIQVLLLGGFTWTLWRADVPRKSLATMFVISLLPEVALGVWQFAAQFVFPMKWLGIAGQDPRNLGVSVVEYDIYRYLRVYGGFPHPNIFGGWLAIGTVVSAWRASLSKTKLHAILFAFAAALFSFALFLTFARSAWIAAAVGMMLLAVSVFRYPEASNLEAEGSAKQFFILALCLSVLLTGIIGYTQRHLIFARVDPSLRLEAKSLDERKQSLVDGVALFLSHPAFGTGPNAELIDLVRSKLPVGKTILISPAQPPHNIYELLFVEFGVVGFVFLAWSIFQSRRILKRIFVSGYWMIFPIAILGLFDHYLLTAWAGEALVAVAVALNLKNQTDTRLDA